MDYLVNYYNSEGLRYNNICITNLSNVRKRDATSVSIVVGGNAYWNQTWKMEKYIKCFDSGDFKNFTEMKKEIKKYVKMCRKNK